MRSNHLQQDFTFPSVNTFDDHRLFTIQLCLSHTDFVLIFFSTKQKEAIENMKILLHTHTIIFSRTSQKETLKVIEFFRAPSILKEQFSRKYIRTRRVQH